METQELIVRLESLKADFNGVNFKMKALFEDAKKCKNELQKVGVGIDSDGLCDEVLDVALTLGSIIAEFDVYNRDLRKHISILETYPTK